MAVGKPGRIFWIFTFVVGIFSPGKGKRRINVRMQDNWRALCRERECNSELTNEAQFLRRENARLHSENEWFREQDSFNEAVFESARVNKNRPAGNKTQSSSSPHMSARPLANASQAKGDTPGNPSGSL